MSPLKKPQTKVVDSLKTQLEELLAALNNLYDTINSEMDRIGSDFDEVHTLLVEGFRTVLDKQPPIDVVEDRPSSSSGSECDEEDSDASGGDSDSSSEEISAEQKAEDRAERAGALVNMVRSWAAASAER